MIIGVNYNHFKYYISQLYIICQGEKGEHKKGEKKDEKKDEKPVEGKGVKS